jgi:hypothetical protein
MDSEVLLTLHIENQRKSLIGATPWNIEIRNSSGQRVAETESGSDRFFKLRPLPEGSSVAKMAVWERGPKMKVRLLPGQKSTEKMDLAHLFKLQPGKYHLKASTRIQMQVDEEAVMRVENVPFEIMK